MSQKPGHRLSRRVQQIEPFHVMEVMRRAEQLEAAGHELVHLELGEPSFETPEPIVLAGKRALEQGKTHYTRAIGLEALRKEIARFYAENMDIDLDWQRVAVTAGASSGLLMALTLVLDIENEILLTDPGYPCYPNYVSLLGSQYRYIALDEQEGFVLTLEKLMRSWSAASRALLLASPANPTGATVDLNGLQSIGAFLEEKSGAFLVDEIYQGLGYSGSENSTQKQTGLQSVLQVSDSAIVTNSFSKFFGMTGWRIGWSVLPESMIPAFERVAQNLVISPTTISQYAALAAFSPETLEIAEQRRNAFNQRRDYLLKELRRLGFGIPCTPEGAFYIYASIDAFSDDSQQFCLELLEKAGLAITPGLDFSASQSKRFVRFSYTASMEALQEAVYRLEKYLSYAL